MARSANNSIWVDGEDRLFANMNRCMEDVQRAAKKGLQRAGMKIVADAQRNMRTAGHNHGTLNNTGRLSQSGRVQDVPNDASAVEIGFFSESAQRGYAAAVEYGSRAHWPPTQDIEAWVRKKLRVAQKRIASVTFLVKRKMSRKGTTAHPFFAPAVKKNQSAISKAITDAIKTVTDKDQN